MKMKYVLPLVIFLALAIFLMVGLNRDPREVPSPLIGKPAPEFSLPRLDDPNKVVSKKDMLGQVWLLNVWSSWCGSCRQEHPTMVKVGKGGQKIAPPPAPASLRLRLPLRPEEPLAAGEGRLALIPPIPQDGAQQIVDVLVVLHHQDMAVLHQSRSPSLWSLAARL